MKTTIEINDDLFQRAKHLAVKREQTLKTVVNLALRQFLQPSINELEADFKLRKHRFRGSGLQQGLSEGDWNAIRQQIYDGHGA